MSAPSSIIARACAMVMAGSKNRPPSENESGVTLRIPMTSGVRPRPSKAASGSRACCTGPVMGLTVVMGWLCARAPAAVKDGPRRRKRSVFDLERQLAGVLAPARDGALGGQEPNQLALPVGLGHRLGELARITDLEVIHRVHAGGGKQFS